MANTANSFFQGQSSNQNADSFDMMMVNNQRGPQSFSNTATDWNKAHRGAYLEMASNNGAVTDAGLEFEPTRSSKWTSALDFNSKYGRDDSSSIPR